jgi:hypothetical protein
MRRSWNFPIADFKTATCCGLNRHFATRLTCADAGWAFKRLSQSLTHSWGMMLSGLAIGFGFMFYQRGKRDNGANMAAAAWPRCQIAGACEAAQEAAFLLLDDWIPQTQRTQRLPDGLGNLTTHRLTQLDMQKCLGLATQNIGSPHLSNENPDNTAS